MLMGSRSQGPQAEGIVPTDSLVERFGLFTIIVLGEVILGVVTGLSAAGPDAADHRDRLAGDGHRLRVVVDLLRPRRSAAAQRGRRHVWTWMLSHLPIQLSIVAAGAAIVSLIEHAHDAATPAVDRPAPRRLRRDRPGRADPDRAIAGGRGPPRGRLPAARRDPRDRRGDRVAGRLARAGAVDPGGAARRDPHRAVVLRRRPDDPGRRLGRGTRRGCACRGRAGHHVGGTTSLRRGTFG